MRISNPLLLLAVVLACFGCHTNRTGPPEASGFVALFPDEGAPRGWVVRDWADVKNPPEKPDTQWKVVNGILQGSDPRGTWLVSEKEYGDFLLEFDWKLGERGNSGCGLRFPGQGDPAFDGIELQMADFRYNTEAKDSELTGGLYRAIAPTVQVYKPTEWNHYQIRLQGPRMVVILNGKKIQDLNLDEQNQIVKRHNGSTAPPIKDRPRRGHIGFQELSRGGSHVEIRNARIKVLN